MRFYMDGQGTLYRVHPNGRVEGEDEKLGWYSIAALPVDCDEMDVDNLRELIGALNASR